MYDVVEQVEAGQIWHGPFLTREQAQAFCDELIAKDPLYADVLTILASDSPPPTAGP